MLYPDQMTFINAALILLFIPIFDKGIYPLAAKCGLLKTPLQKIITGGVLLAISFLIRYHLAFVYHFCPFSTGKYLTYPMYSKCIFLSKRLPETRTGSQRAGFTKPLIEKFALGHFTSNFKLHT